MSKALESLFAACEELEASDVHVMAGRKPSFRVRGSLAPNGDFRELDAAGGYGVRLDCHSKLPQ